MAQQYEFISSDTHLEVLPERSTGRVPAKYRDKMPRTVTHPDGGDAMQLRALRSSRWGLSGPARGSQQPRLAAVRRDGRRHRRGGPARAAAARARYQDGSSPRCCSPTCRLGRGSGGICADEDAYRAAVRAYNDWLGEEYCAVSPERLIGLGVIPMTSIEDASRSCSTARASASRASCSARFQWHGLSAAGGRHGSGPPPSTCRCR